MPPNQQSSGPCRRRPSSRGTGPATVWGCAEASRPRSRPETAQRRAAVLACAAGSGTVIVQNSRALAIAMRVVRAGPAADRRQLAPPGAVVEDTGPCGTRRVALDRQQPVVGRQELQVPGLAERDGEAACPAAAEAARAARWARRRGAPGAQTAAMRADSRVAARCFIGASGQTLRRGSSSSGTPLSESSGMCCTVDSTRVERDARERLVLDQRGGGLLDRAPVALQHDASPCRAPRRRTARPPVDQVERRLRRSSRGPAATRPGTPRPRARRSSRARARLGHAERRHHPPGEVAWPRAGRRARRWTGTRTRSARRRRPATIETSWRWRSGSCATT